MRKKTLGFTIGELVIVIAVIAVAVPAVFGVFFSVLYGKSKVNILQEVKRNGDSAMNTMKYLIQSRAAAIYSDSSLTTEVCSNKYSLGTAQNASNTLYFQDKDSPTNYFYFISENDNNGTPGDTSDDVIKIAYYSGMTRHNLTNNKVGISNFTLTCKRLTEAYNSFPVVTIGFTLKKSGAAGRQEETTSLTYGRKIKLRN